MPINSPETIKPGLHPEGAPSPETLQNRQESAAEFLDAQKLGQASTQEQAPGRQVPIEQVLEKPESDKHPEEMSDLTLDILKKLEGKTPAEKIHALLSGNYDPNAQTEAMAAILAQQEKDHAKN